MCGIPGSGKTTLATQLSQEYDLALYSYDYLRNNRRPEWGCISAYLLELVIQSLLDNQSVIVDDMYITKESRQKLLSAISDIECKKTLIVLQTPLELCIERDRTRTSHNLGKPIVCNFNKKYEPPSLEEGWDEILYY